MTALASPGSCVEYLTCEVKTWLAGVVSVIGYKSVTVISVLEFIYPFAFLCLRAF
jgi:hypothetical protein